jgi:hypothetical protein
MGCGVWGLGYRDHGTKGPRDKRHAGAGGWDGRRWQWVGWEGRCCRPALEGKNSKPQIPPSTMLRAGSSTSLRAGSGGRGTLGPVERAFGELRVPPARRARGWWGENLGCYRFGVKQDVFQTKWAFLGNQLTPGRSIPPAFRDEIPGAEDSLFSR